MERKGTVDPLPIQFAQGLGFLRNSESPGTSSSMSATQFADMLDNKKNPFGIAFNFLPDDIRNEYLAGLRSISNSSEYDQSKAKTGEILTYLEDMASKGDQTALEILFGYYASKESELNAREYTAQREDTAYQRLIEDLRKAGVSPYILSGAAPMSMASTSKTYNSSSFASRENNERTNKTAMTKETLSKIFHILGIALMAFAMA